MRKLKYHEQKLLKKVDFIHWEVDNNLHEVKILKKYCIQKREDYIKYKKLARDIRELARKIKEIDPRHPFRTEESAHLLEKLLKGLGLFGLSPNVSFTTTVDIFKGGVVNDVVFEFENVYHPSAQNLCVNVHEVNGFRYLMGLIPTRWDLSLAEKVTASCFCRRRLPVVMVRNKMSESIKGATKLIEQGHVRIGPELIKDPAFLLTRTHEDFVTWVNSSKIRRHILEYEGLRDDFII